ncbi:RpnC/YadD family protein [Zavarzinella formosa]|uniref:hypothetical protein n=1 Tax=Zavarzinella formosa TaxID=360055 RepID=UPI00031EEBDF|nr:hypothetical protein [Zavarzinella formosa]
MDHDQFFKKLMHLFLRDFFEIFFPAWVNRFRFDQVEWVEQEIFPDPPRGEKLVVDVLAKLPVIPADPPRENEPRESVALVLIETEGSTRLADFRQRMYDYTTGAGDKLGLDVLPVAIFLNLRMEGRNTDVFERWFWERRILTFEYDYVALPGLRAEDYAHHPNPLAAAWSTLMNMERDRRALAAVEAMDVIAASPLDIERKHLLLDFIQSYAPLEETQKRDLNELLIDPKRERTLAMKRLWSEEMKEEGVQQGMQQGMQQGTLLTQRRIAERLCRTKFPELPDDKLQNRLGRLSGEELEQLTVRILSATTAAEIGFDE